MQWNIADITGLIKTWANKSENVQRVLLAGSCARMIATNRPIGRSDVDLIVFVTDLSVSNGDVHALSELGLSIGVLIHPLIISSEDAEMKGCIAEYRHMIETSVPIYTEDNENV